MAGPTRRTRQSVRPCVLAVTAAMLAAGLAEGRAQQRFMSGQAVMPAYEGWERNADGSFDLVFGTMNRNWAEVIDIPIGPANNIEPGGPDQGQPTHFLPRRNRFLFRVRVPADFGDNEVVWTLTSPNGETKRAYATLHPDYFLDDLVLQRNNGAPAADELLVNEAPVLMVEGGTSREVTAGEPLTLRARVEDDGLLTPAALPPTDPERPGPRHQERRPRPAPGLVRLPRRRQGDLRAAAVQGVGGYPRGFGLALGARLDRAAGAARRHLGGAGDVQRARRLRPALPGPRRWPHRGGGHHRRGRAIAGGIIGSDAAMGNEFTTVLERDGDWYVAYSPEIPGANGQGRTKEEARQSLRDAIALVLAERREDGLREMPADAVRRARAQAAVAAIQDASLRSGAHRMSLGKINAEIDAVRRARARSPR